MDIALLAKAKRNSKIPDIAPGDTVKVHARIVEGGKERIQVFQGVVLKMKGGGNGASFTVRHVAYGIGVERTFPLYSPLVEKVEIVRQGKVRRSRLYYLRSLSGKEARRKIKRVERKARQVGEELIEAEPEEILEPEDVLMDEDAVAEDEATVEEEAAEAMTEEISEAEAEERPEAEAEEKPEAAIEEPEASVEEAPAAEEDSKAVAEETPDEEPVAEAPEEPSEEPDKE